MPNTLMIFNIYRSVMTDFPSWEILGKSFFETSKRFWLVFLLLSWKKKPFTSSGSIFSLFALWLFFFLCKKLVDGREWSHNQQYAYKDCTYMYWQDAINNQTCLKKWNWIFWFVYNKYNKYHINIIWYVYKSINKLAGFGTLGLSTAPWVNLSPWAR